MNCSRNNQWTSNLTSSELLHKILEEDVRYRQTGRSDPQYLASLWCRVFCHEREDAWTSFAAYYRKKSLSWTASSCLSGDDFDEIYNDSLLKLSQMMTLEKFHGFSSPWQLSRYFARIVWTKTTDFLRSTKSRQSVSSFSDNPLRDDDGEIPKGYASLLDLGPLPDDVMILHERAAAVWSCVESHVQDDLERLIMFEYYVNDKMPRHISALLEQRHHVFLKPAKINHMRRNVILRMRKNPNPILSTFL